MPSPTYQTKQLSTPKFLVDGVVVPIVPNTCTARIPGDAKVRAMSAGGGSTQVVTGLDASTLIAHVKVELAATAQNADRVRDWKQRMIDGVGMTIEIVDTDFQMTGQNMHFTKETTLHFKSDGNVDCEWEGQYLP